MFLDNCASGEPRPAHQLGQKDRALQQVWICSSFLLLMRCNRGETLHIAVHWVLHCCALILLESGGQELCIHQMLEGSPYFGGIPSCSSWSWLRQRGDTSTRRENFIFITQNHHFRSPCMSWTVQFQEFGGTFLCFQLYPLLGASRTFPHGSLMWEQLKPHPWGYPGCTKVWKGHLHRQLLFAVEQLPTR